MTPIPISQCEKGLDFAPLSAYPRALPAYAIEAHGKHWLISGFERCEGLAIVLSGQFNEILKSVYSELTLSETARLFQNLALQLGAQTARELLPLYGLRAHEENISLLKRIASLPLEFQNWMSSKSVGVREMSFLGIVPVERLRPATEAIARSHVTKVQGVLILETWCELVAIGRDPGPLDLARPDEELKRLVALRYPETSGRDESRTLKVKQLPWPAHTQARWVRQGDQAGIEVKFQLNSVHDLDKQIQGLQHLRRNMADDLWKMN